jgi:hypothetical protein
MLLVISYFRDVVIIDVYEVFRYSHNPHENICNRACYYKCAGGILISLTT